MKNKHKRTTKIKLNDPYSYFPRLIRWLSSQLTKSTSKETSYALWVTNKILTVLKTRGKTQAIKYGKDLRSTFLQIILSMSEEFEIKGNTRIPHTLKPIIRHIQESKSYPFIRLIFSSLYITRFIRLEVKPSFSTIEERPYYVGSPQNLRNDIVQFLKECGVNTKHGLGKVPNRLKFGSFHMSSKSGPNGHALWTSYLDIMSIPPRLWPLIEVVGGKKLVELSQTFLKLYHRIPSFFDQFRTRKGTRTCRRLIVIPDKEGKSREVACLDYYSQAALLPLHNYLFKFLARIRQDCTHEQTKLFKYLKARSGNQFHSVDLTAATDRFPITIQREILDVWFGKEYADAWMNLMVSEPFLYKQTRKVQYNTGNPMGAYSSWASFATAHHFFVYLACKRAKRNWKMCDYMLLGDDIVIAHDAVAKEYKNILNEWCIPYSPEKTHTSPYGFEFAKQVRLHKENISPFPLSALYDRRSETFTSIGIIWYELTYKGWQTSMAPIVTSYLVDVLRHPRPLIRHLTPKIQLVTSLMSFFNKSSAGLGKPILDYVAAWTKENYKYDSFELDLYSQYLALRILEKSFKESHQRIVTGNKPLGQLATDMVIHITSLRDGGADCFDLIESVPFLQIYGRAEETYLDLISRQEYLSVYMLSESKSLLKKSTFATVDMPLSDEAFYLRHRDVLVSQSLKVAKSMIDLLQSTPSLSIPQLDIKLKFPWALHCKTQKEVVWESKV